MGSYLLYGIALHCMILYGIALFCLVMHSFPTGQLAPAHGLTPISTFYYLEAQQAITIRITVAMIMMVGIQLFQAGSPSKEASCAK